MNTCKVCGIEVASGRQKYCSDHTSVPSLRQKQRDESRRKLGRCRRCNTPLAPNSVAFCETHLEINRQAQRERSKRQKETGRCKYCNDPLSAKSTVFCEKHRLQSNARSLNYERARRAERRCTDCNKETATFRKSRCLSCDAIHQKKMANLCKKKDCGLPIGAELKHYCRTHADEANVKLAERRMRLKKENKCYFCQNELTAVEIGVNSLCTKCRTSRSERRTSKRSEN